MTTEEIDLVEEILGPAAAAQWTPPESAGWDWTPFGGSSEYVKPKRRIHLHNPFARLKTEKTVEAPKVEVARAVAAKAEVRHFSAARVAAAFAIGAVATFLVVGAVAAAALSVYANRAVPGVSIGTVDVSGLTRDQIITTLSAKYAYLAQGKATVTTPNGVATITYAEAGRAPDTEAMADAAMALGHSGNPVEDAVYMLRSALGGAPLPVVVRIDPTAIAGRLHVVGGTDLIPAHEASVTASGSSFVVSASTDGIGVNERAVAGGIIDSLMKPDAPADLQVRGTFQKLDPVVTTQDAQSAVAAAQKMVVDINLSWTATTPAATPAATASPTPTPTPTPSPSPTLLGASPGTSATPSASPSAGPTQSPVPITAGTFKIEAQTVRSWIVFGMRPDGTYGPAADPNLVQAYVASLSKQVGSRAVEPSVVYTSGTPSALKGGRDGTGFDVPTDSQTIEAYLAQLSLGANPTAVLAMATAPVSPQITLDSLTGMTIIGSWTTTFYPDISNGMGANIRIPATLLNGQVVAPGQQFSFLRAVSPIDTAHGFTLGGVIVHGKSDHTGAIGGGICSASTTMFNAAARAGLQIDERHAHSYYINRYPVGLDATVYSNGYSAMDLKWTNDTANPILIRGRTTKGSKSTITIELWSLPLNRTVTFSPQYKSNVQKATDHTVYTTALKVGQQNRAEYPTDGFDTSRTRTVTDSTGKVLHTDTWTSHYIRVDGLLEIGHKATPTPPPSKSPAAPGAGLSIVTAEPPRSPLRLS
jgi:vancomycin resistance protein YoaR